MCENYMQLQNQLLSNLDKESTSHRYGSFVFCEVANGILVNVFAFNSKILST